MTSPSPAPLTDAEQAAARALAGDFECTWHIGCDEECRADMARAVVAAVRNLIAAEALEQAANALDEDARKHRDSVMSGQSTDSFEFIEGIEHASGLVEARIQPLSLPASKETE